jgi:orotate phosphoribosyltransferase
MDVKNWINDNAIARAALGERTLYQTGATPGSDNPKDYARWFFMLKNAMYEPKVMLEITKFFLDKFGEQLKNGAVLVGIEHASTALVTSIVRNADFQVIAFSIRKEEKLYGEKGWIEGKFVKADKYILIDDLSSPLRGTLKIGLEQLKKLNDNFTAEFFCIVNTGSNNEHDGVKITSMFTKEDFILDQEEYINAKISEQLNVSSDNRIEPSAVGFEDELHHTVDGRA